MLARLGRGRVRRPALAAGDAFEGTISVVIPARDEAARIGPCLDGLAGDPDVLEVIVVDDGSTDDTAAVAAARGARVVTAGAAPDGVGRQALGAAARARGGARRHRRVRGRRHAPAPRVGGRGRGGAAGGETSADAASPAASAAGAASPATGAASPAASGGGAPVLVSVGARFVCSTAGERWLHPALLATLVYRYGPPDADARVAISRLMINGQCTAVRRAALLEAGGYAEAAGHMTDDAAFARGLARRGWRVVFHDGGGLIDVDMHESAAETWREWGRSIALPDVTSPAWRAADVAVVWLTLGLPWLRLVSRRARRVDFALLALRLAMTGAFAPSYARRGVPYWLSPLADVAAAVRLTWSAARPARRWRGRVYE